VSARKQYISLLLVNKKIGLKHVNLLIENTFSEGKESGLPEYSICINVKE
jgi:hypothetical protein